MTAQRRGGEVKALKIPVVNWTYGLVCIVALLGCATPKTMEDAKPQSAKLTAGESDGRVELVGKDGQLRYWVDRFGRVHSPEMTLAAEAYNEWIRTRYRGLFGVETPKVEFISHVPPGPRGIDPNDGVFRIPHRIHSDGALTRDLLSVPFFQLGARLAGQWNLLLLDCRKVKPNTSDAECARFAPDLRAITPNAPGPIDDHWLELRLRELQKARALLQAMQRVLEGVPMVAPGGQVFTYEDDVRHYRARLDECWGILRLAPQIPLFGGGSFCTLHPELVNHPPEWITEYVEGEVVTAQIARVLQSFEWQIARYLDTENMEAQLTAQSLGLPASR
jgi:hypothetical protein